MTRDAGRWVGMLPAIAVAAALVFLAQRLMDPAPIPALGAVGGGLLALWWRRSPGWIAGGAAVGAAGGAAVHGYSHVVEGRLDPSGSWVGHVAGDAALGLLIGALVLAMAGLVDSRFGGPSR